MTAPHLITPIDWAIEALARAAADGADLREAAAARIESTRFRVCAERIAELVAELAGARTRLAMTQEQAMHAMAEADDLRAEVERLKMVVLQANAQAEEFERRWYLSGDEVERLRAKLAGERERERERERIAAHFDARDRGHDGKPLGIGYYEPHEPAEIIRRLAAAGTGTDGA